MESIADENDNLIIAINEILDAMRERDEIEDRRPGRTYHFISIIEEADSAIESGSPDDAYNKISRLLALFDDNTVLSTEEYLLFENAKKLQSNLADELGIDKDPFPIIEPTAESDIHNIPLIHKIFDQRISEFKKEIKSEKDLLVSTQVEATRRNHDISTTYKTQTDKLNKLIRETEEKHESINELLESAAGRVIASDYQKSAVLEKETADKLRRYSLFFMCIAALVLILTVFESAGNAFSMESSIFRLFTAALLSIPAAYLARESARHREQQYMHHQTSLDLITITPYISTLPEDVQHDIKADIAKRLFAYRQTPSTEAYSMPINANEMVMELIKKIEPLRSHSTKNSMKEANLRDTKID